MSAKNLLKLYYQGSAGIGLAESWNINAFPTSYGQNDPALQQAAFAATQNYLPYPQFGSINFLSNTGHSTYHAATAQFRKLYSHGLVLDTFYTFSKVLDDCDTDYGVCTGVEPVTNRNLNKGRAGFDMSHRWVASFTYEVPIGKGRRFLNRGGILNMLIGGYEVAWIQTAESGNPVGFTFVNSPYNYYPTTIGNWVPNVVKRPTMPQFGLGSAIGPNRFNQALSNAVVDISDFAAPPPFTPGNAGRNIMTGPGAFYSMVSAKKNFRITERFNLQFRWDFQNPFHNYAFSPPSTQVDFKNPQLFGKMTSDVATANIQGEPLMNFQLRLSW
jgi:hypothetical protein